MGKIAVVLFLMLATMGCESKLESPTTRALKGRHKLHELTTCVEGADKVTDKFFLFSDELNQGDVEHVRVKFSWQTADGSFANSELPLSKIKTKIDGRTNTPTISFEWKEPSGGPQLTPQELMDRAVTSATIFVREESHWPPFVHVAPK